MGVEHVQERILLGIENRHEDHRVVINELLLPALPLPMGFLLDGVVVLQSLYHMGESEA